jgi:hypothetical protein
VRRVGWNVGRLTGSHDRFGAAEGKLYLALENGKHLLEIVAMRRRAAAGRNKHVNETVATGGVFACQKNRVGITGQSNVRQSLVFVWSRKRKIPLKVVGRNGRTLCCHS